MAGEEKDTTKEALKEALEDVFKNFFLAGGSSKAKDPETVVQGVMQENLKRLPAEFLQLSLSGHHWADIWKHQIFADNHTQIQSLRSRELQMLDNLVDYCKSVDSRNLIHLPIHDKAFVNLWTYIDELVASLMAKTGLEHDVVMTLLIKVLTDAIVPKLEEAAKKAKAA